MEGDNTIIEKDIKLLAVRMLIALKHFYTFKELETLLEIPLPETLGIY